MQHCFYVEPVPADYVYGDAAGSILDVLGRKFRSELGVQTNHWAMWVFENGLGVPVPTQVDSTALPVIRALRLFVDSLHVVEPSVMKNGNEQDKHALQLAIGYAEQLISPQILVTL